MNEPLWDSWPLPGHQVLPDMPPKYYVRLKHEGHTVAVLQGDTRYEAHRRAEILARGMTFEGADFTIEDA